VIRDTYFRSHYELHLTRSKTGRLGTREELLSFSRCLLSALVCLAILAPRARAQSGEVWSGYTRVTNLYPAASGLAFNTVYANPGLSSCDSHNRWVIASTTANYQTLVASLIAAFMSGKEVDMNIAAYPVSCTGRVNRFVIKE
jgi:hypothetical protein